MELIGPQWGRVKSRELRLAIGRGAGPCDEAHLDARLAVPSAGELRDVARAELCVCREGDSRKGLEEGRLPGALVSHHDKLGLVSC